MKNFANNTQLEELAAYIASQINVPTIGIGGGYAPIGTIISVMGTTAPQDYLACDGTVYNIADYPQLADYFESQFGESNHFGGNGTTTFAVPDLQGEFLRGTGTNSHANQGSGANVGEHQDATNVPVMNGYTEGTMQYFYTPGYTTEVQNVDAISRTGGGVANVATRLTTGGPFPVEVSVRPTNTSVLYCIKAVVAGEVYSTEERVVGTWIDGKKIYQRTFDLSNHANWDPNQNVATGINIPNVEQLVYLTGSAQYTGDNNWFMIPHALATPSNMAGQQSSCFVLYVNGDVHFITGPGITFKNLKFTIRYTKTTDG